MVRLRAASEAVRNSLFFVPVLCVVLGVALAAGMLEIDRRVRLEPAPSLLRVTVESARELLGTVAAAIITVTGIVFALTGLSVQLASSQFSPRVVRGFLRDRSAQVSIGFMVGTFTYSLVVLRAIRSVEAGPDVVPALSTALALGHTAAGWSPSWASSAGLPIDCSRASSFAVSPRRRSGLSPADYPNEDWAARGRLLSCPLRSPSGGCGPAPPDGSRKSLRKHSSSCLPPGGVARVEVQVGRFVHPGRRLCTVWGETDHREALERQDEQSLRYRTSGTMQQDIGFGIRQIVDIALRALSPGVNDPTTAHESASSIWGRSPTRFSAGISRRLKQPVRTAGGSSFPDSCRTPTSWLRPSTRIRQSAVSLPVWGRLWWRRWPRSSPIWQRTVSSTLIAPTRSSGRPGSSSPASRRPDLCWRTRSGCGTLLRLCFTAVMNLPVAPLRTRRAKGLARAARLGWRSRRCAGGIRRLIGVRLGLGSGDLLLDLVP